MTTTREFALQNFEAHPNMVFPSDIQDEKSHNTIVLPFKVHFDGRIAIVPWMGDGVVRSEQRITVVEVAAGAWLSQIVSILARARDAPVNGVFIYYINAGLGEFLQKHAADPEATGALGTWPNYFNREADVPGGYDHDRFDPDLIYRGQRFLIVWPSEAQDFSDDPVDVVPVSDIWLGILQAGGGDAAVYGSEYAGGIILSLEDPEPGEEDDWYGLQVTAEKWGPGLGAFLGTSIILAWGYDKDTIKEEISGEKEWQFDWDLSVGTKWKSVLNKLKYIEKIIKFAESAKKLQKGEKILARRGEILEGARQLINVLSEGKPTSRGFVVIGIPGPHSPALHVRVGVKQESWQCAFRSYPW